MLSRKKFKHYLNEIHSLIKLEEEFNKVVDKFVYDKEFISLDRHNELIIKLLEETMNDKERLLSTYIYETDWGRYIVSDNTYIDQQLCDIKNFDELYDLLVYKYKKHLKSIKNR